MQKPFQALQTLRFEKALKEYVTAWGHASLDEQLSSASKNIASAHWRLAVLHAPGEVLFEMHHRLAPCADVRT